MNNDLISRQAAIDHLQHRLIETAINNVEFVDKVDHVYEELAYNRIEAWIDEIPFVQPKQKVGYWITDGVDYCCSECSFKINDEYYLGKGIACPNCGAFMKEGLNTVLG